LFLNACFRKADAMGDVCHRADFVGEKGKSMFSSNFQFLLTERLPKATAVNAYRWETSGVVATRWRLIAKTINRKSGLFL